MAPRPGRHPDRRPAGCSAASAAHRRRIPAAAPASYPSPMSARVAAVAMPPVATAHPAPAWTCRALRCISMPALPHPKPEQGLSCTGPRSPSLRPGLAIPHPRRRRFPLPARPRPPQSAGVRQPRRPLHRKPVRRSVPLTSRHRRHGIHHRPRPHPHRSTPQTPWSTPSSTTMATAMGRQHTVSPPPLLHRMPAVAGPRMRRLPPRRRRSFPPQRTCTTCWPTRGGCCRPTSSTCTR